MCSSPEEAEQGLQQLTGWDSGVLLFQEKQTHVLRRYSPPKNQMYIKAPSRILTVALGDMPSMEMVERKAMRMMKSLETSAPWKKK